MSVQVKALRDFRFKGKIYEQGETLTMQPHAAVGYIGAGFVKPVDSDQKEKVTTFQEKREKKTAGPGHK